MKADVPLEHLNLLGFPADRDVTRALTLLQERSVLSQTEIGVGVEPPGTRSQR